MIETMSMAETPKFITEAELFGLFASKSNLDKRQVSYKLSGEARRIITAEAKRYGVDQTKALEIILREIRELRKKKR